MSSEILRGIFTKHLPDPAVEYCFQLWEKQVFSFEVTASRKSKLGDFRYRKDRKIQTITLNGDLNPYQFLLTYIHEVAHLHAFLRFGMTIPPHGIEWKITFQQLMAPLLHERVFPIDLLVPLRNHMRNPKASSAADLFLMREMLKYDHPNGNTGERFLSEVRPGSKFSLAGRIFEKGETRRTRVVCLELSSGKKFLIAQLARVKTLG